MAFSSTQIPSANSSSTPHWGVFLSFSGKDTRYNFTSHFYSALDRRGIRTFMDDTELTRGDVISSGLLKAIQESEAYIVVLSKNYASSSWCLDELVEILQCCKSMGRLVLPVFYNIGPSVVRHQTGSFKKAFQRHEVHILGNMDKVNKWRLALTEVADFSGYHISEKRDKEDKLCITLTEAEGFSRFEICQNRHGRSEAYIINEVVDRVLLEINPTTLYVAKYPVGIESRVKTVTSFFSDSTNGVHWIGIYGMGGVGKTTLAKAVYNQNCGRFQGSCFLADVREASGTPRGLVCLQQQLIDDVLKCKNITVHNVDQGIKLIGARICSTKVLIVLDDLDHLKPLEFLVGPFTSGSVIIITTRNEDLLDTIKVESRYKVNELGESESWQLFAQHAFRENKISDTFVEFSEEILRHAGGLPLAIKVFASNLLNQPEVRWRWFIDKLQRVPNDYIQEKLMIGFDALKLVDPMLQDIFLDIACFFVGRKKDNVVKLLETCYNFGDYNIEILKKRCLITINDENVLEMHDLLEDMGMRIAYNRSPDEPGKHSRLFDRKDICNVLTKDKATESIEGIIPLGGYYEGALTGVSLNSETFKRMHKLRFLYITNAEISGSFQGTFENLRWLYWSECPLKWLPFDFRPPKLVILELHHSQMDALWGNTMFLEQLKILDLSYSYKLTTTPDFTGVLCLETLILYDCKSLEEVDTSIGRLTRLISLDLGNCCRLRSLPSSICDLPALKYLDLNNCTEFENFPKDLGKVKSLLTIDASWTSITTLPESMCDLRALESLDIGYCKFEELPRELGKIISLTKLKAPGLLISKVPSSIGGLTNLVKLILQDSHNLKTLPDTICNLRSLQRLNINECPKLEELPKQMWKIESLRELHADGSNLRILPDIALGLALSLREIDLYGNNFTALPLGIGQLPNLEKIILTYCNRLQFIAELPSNLKHLDAKGCASMLRLPNLSNLKQLEVLDLTDCISLTKIQGLERLISIRQLYMGGCYTSLLAHTFQKSLFQIYSAFGNQIDIYLRTPEIPHWISHPSFWSTVSLVTPTNVLSNFLGMILRVTYRITYSGDIVNTHFIENRTSGLTWRMKLYHEQYTLLAIIPETIFPLKRGDRVHVTINRHQCGIHLLYEPDIVETVKYDTELMSM